MEPGKRKKLREERRKKLVFRKRKPKRTPDRLRRLVARGGKRVPRARAVGEVTLEAGGIVTDEAAWKDMQRASEETSLRFLKSEPDLDDDDAGDLGFAGGAEREGGQG